jgi:hypothetical protein
MSDNIHLLGIFIRRGISHLTEPKKQVVVGHRRQPPLL